MRNSRSLRRFTSLLIFCVSLTTVGVDPARSACTTPPNASPRFAGKFGSIDSPFLFPGQGRTVGLTGGCAQLPEPFQPSDVVTLVFTPPSGQRNVVVLKHACEPNWIGSPEHQQCVGQLNGGTASCENGANHVGPAPGTEFNFRVPNIAFAGPVTVAVTAAGTPLPCGLANATCSSLQGASLRSCIDQLYQDATCTAQHGTFPGVTALPDLKDFGRLCTPDKSTPPPHCKGDDHSLRFAIDANGNILIPMQWGGVLQQGGAAAGTPCGPGGVCNKRDIYASTAVEAFPGGSAGIQLPNSQGLASFNLYGQQFDRPPRFELGPPQPNELSLVGDADKRESILRIARCPGGGNCTTGYFDFRTRMDNAVGPVTISATTGRRVCDGGSNAGALCSADPNLCGPGFPCVAARGGVR